MNTKLLRLKILDLAFKGQLVEQDIANEHADVLLKQIRVEKIRLLQEGEVRRDKYGSTIFAGDDGLIYEKSADDSVSCIDDLIPYDLPEGWSWTRIGSVFIVNPRNDAKDDTIASFVPMPLIDDSYSNHFTYQERPWGEIRSGFTHFAEGDIGLAKITPCLENRKSVIFTNLVNGIGAGTTELHIFRPILEDLILPEYLLWFFKTERFINDCIGAFSGAVGQQRVGKDFVASYFLPVPPVAEQKKIIMAIELAFEQITSVESDKGDLQSTVATTKAKILSLAIQGRLVPQDPNDEPASVLLKRIKSARKRLVDMKKIKRDKGDSYSAIGNDDLPQGWEWSTFIQLYNFIDYRGVTPQKISSGIPLITARNVRAGFIDYTIAEYISRESYEERKGRGISKKGDILFTTEAPLGNAAIADIDEYSAGQRIITFQNYSEDESLSNRLFMWFLLTDFFKDQLTEKQTGTTVYGIKAEKLKQLYLPVPPLAEQQRIVAAIETSFKQLDKIQESLT